MGRYCRKGKVVDHEAQRLHPLPQASHSPPDLQPLTLGCDHSSHEGMYDFVQTTVDRHIPALRTRRQSPKSDSRPHGAGGNHRFEKLGGTLLPGKLDDHTGRVARHSAASFLLNKTQD